MEGKHFKTGRGELRGKVEGEKILNPRGICVTGKDGQKVRDTDPLFNWRGRKGPQVGRVEGYTFSRVLGSY